MERSILRRFEEPDEIRLFEKGRFEIVHIGGLTIGRASYEPGAGNGPSTWLRLLVVPFAASNMSVSLSPAVR